MSKKSKQEKEQVKAKAQKMKDVQEVKMKFKEDKFYSDPTIAHFEAGKVYSVKGADLIQRWLKRGGEIVEGKLEIKEPVQNPSKIIPSPLSSNPEEVASDMELEDNEPNEIVTEDPIDEEDDQE